MSIRSFLRDASIAYRAAVSDRARRAERTAMRSAMIADEEEVESEAQPTGIPTAAEIAEAVAEWDLVMRETQPRGPRTMA